MARFLAVACAFLVGGLVAVAADINVGSGEKFPAKAKVGDIIKFDRPSVGGRNMITVKADGREVKGVLESDKVNGQPVIGAGKYKFAVEATRPGPLTIEITIAPAGGKAETKTHTIDVK